MGELNTAKSNEVNMKSILKTPVISALMFLGLLCLIIVGTQTFGASGQLAPRSTYSPGDPYTTLFYPPTEVPPPDYAKPPIVTIPSPVNDTVITANNGSLNFSLTLEASNSSRPITLGPVSYKASWMSNNITIGVGDSSAPFLTKTLPLSIDLANMPEGTQSITVYAYASCEYETRREQTAVSNDPFNVLVFKYLNIYYNAYKIGGSSSVNFTFDSLPKVSVLSPINKTYNEDRVPLIFTVDKTVNWFGYSLDGKQNQTITGNTTLSGLSSGLHNVTVYAKDAVGSVGASENIIFAVSLPPFPYVPAAAVLGISAVVIGASIFVYFKKFKLSG